MGDILASAHAWLNGMRVQHMARNVSYTRGGVTSPCLATVNQTVFETQSEFGVVERWESRDYVVSAAQLPVDIPQRGDRITEVVGGNAVVMEVSAPRGMPAWRWADSSRTAVRIHTTVIEDPSLTETY